MFEYSVLGYLKGNYYLALLKQRVLTHHPVSLYRSEARVQRVRVRQEPRIKPDSDGPSW